MGVRLPWSMNVRLGEVHFVSARECCTESQTEHHSGARASQIVEIRRWGLKVDSWRAMKMAGHQPGREDDIHLFLIRVFDQTINN